MKQWQGQFASPKVIQNIRSKIEGAIRTDRTVLLDFDGVEKLPPEILQQITAGWSEQQVKTIFPRGEK